VEGEQRKMMDFVKDLQGRDTIAECTDAANE
jgi:hypothetical protein